MNEPSDINYTVSTDEIDVHVRQTDPPTLPLGAIVCINIPIEPARVHCSKYRDRLPNIQHGPK